MELRCGDLVLVAMPLHVGAASKSLEILAIYLSFRTTKWSDKYCFFNFLTANGLIEFPIRMGGEEKIIEVLQKIS